MNAEFLSSEDLRVDRLSRAKRYIRGRGGLAVEPNEPNEQSEQSARISVGCAGWERPSVEERVIDVDVDVDVAVNGVGEEGAKGQRIPGENGCCRRHRKYQECTLEYNKWRPDPTRSRRVVQTIYAETVSSYGSLYKPTHAGSPCNPFFFFFFLALLRSNS